MTSERGNIGAAPVGWYRPDTWRRLKQIIPDPGNYFDTYEMWVANAEALLASLKEKGIATEKVYIDPDEMLAWARAQNRSVDSKARSEYAIVAYMKEHPSGSN